MEAMVKMLDNDDLKGLLATMRSYTESSGQGRDEFVHGLEETFKGQDKNGNGVIDRSEFDGLIRGYFEMKGIKQTQEVYDHYFTKIDSDHSNGISLVEFTAFVDGVNRNEFIPAIENEIKSRGL